ncbi:helix-turn-helix domain-containing protein [Pseudokineococcus basanitobsidens]|uniref:Helix-turn-helix domain-containing protein n=1 Tax=Pseudokineococcus basanitobsidens TaxID=1926649 RepID=A0ABU8RM63_9ACTN
MSASRTTSRTTAAAPADFNVIAELGDVVDVGLLADADWADTVLDTLRPYRPVLGRSAYGRLEVIATLPATDLPQATRTAMAVLADVRRPDSSPLPAYSLEVLPTHAFDHRTRFVDVPPLLSVPEAAAALGISRQAVLKRIETGALPASRIGSVWAVAAAAMPSPPDDGPDTASSSASAPTSAAPAGARA